MQASFGWDWGLAAPSLGIWKNVHLDLYDSALVRDVTYSLTEEVDGWETYWILNMYVYMETGLASAEIEGTMIYELKP